jgi:hypothetical protein
MDDEEHDDYIMPCPHCGEDIFDEAEQCPYCHQYLTAADFKKQIPTWVIVLIVLTIASFLLPTLLTALRSLSGQ